MVTMLSFMVDPIKETNLPLKTRFIQAKVWVAHHLPTHILFPKQGNLKFPSKRIL